MSSPKPPAVATWLLEHLAIGPNKDAVSGDLFEQFSQRPSVAWYWRQVLLAIGAGLWNERYILWLAAGGMLVWQIVWQMVLSQIGWSMWIFKETSGLLFTAYPLLPWPMSSPNTIAFESAPNSIPLLLVLCAYLAVIKNFNLHTLARGLLVGLLVLPFSVILRLALVRTFFFTFPGVLLQPPYRSFIIEHWTVAVPVLHAFDLAITSISLFVVLVLAMWAARTTRAERAELSRTMEGEHA